MTRIVFEEGSECKVPDREQHVSENMNVCTDRDWASQPQTHKNTSGEVVQWGDPTLAARSRTQQSVRVSSAKAELFALRTGIAEGDLEQA